MWITYSCDGGKDKTETPPRQPKAHEQPKLNSLPGRNLPSDPGPQGNGAGAGITLFPKTLNIPGTPGSAIGPTDFIPNPKAYPYCYSSRPKTCAGNPAGQKRSHDVPLDGGYIFIRCDGGCITLHKVHVACSGHSKMDSKQSQLVNVSLTFLKSVIFPFDF